MVCVNDLKMVFRDPTDLGLRRTQTTPNPSVCMERLENFIAKWGKCEIGGWKVLNDGALKEMSCLKVHIRRGCLANMNPSTGTNRNENLHRHINPHFSNRSRIGLPFALALLTILFFNHNCSIEEKHIYRKTATYIPYNYGVINRELLNSPIPAFGKHLDQHNISWLLAPPTNIEDLKPASLQEACTSTALANEVSELISIDEIWKVLENAVGMAS